MIINKKNFLKVVSEEYAKILISQAKMNLTESRLAYFSESVLRDGLIDEGFFSDLFKSKDAKSMPRSVVDDAMALSQIEVDTSEKIRSIYNAVLSSLQKKLGLTDAEAAEKAQDIMTIVSAKLIPSIEPAAQPARASFNQEIEDYLSGKTSTVAHRPKVMGRPLPRTATSRGRSGAARFAGSMFG